MESGNAISDLLADYDENIATVGQLAQDVMVNSHVSLLGLLCGDVSPKVIWKSMYMCHRYPCIQTRCTMLSVLTDYVANSPALLENINTEMIRVLAQCWESDLLLARKQLDADSFTAFNLTLARCTLALRSYNLHHDFHEAMKLSAKLRDPSCDLSTVPEGWPPSFPLSAIIPHRKLMSILTAGSASIASRQLTVSARQSITKPSTSIHVTTAQKLSASVNHTGTTPVLPTPAAPTRSFATTPVRQVATTPVRQAATTPVRQVTTTPVRQVATTPVRQVATTPVRQVATTPVRQAATTPVRQVATTPVRQVATTPVRQVATTPVRQVATTPVRQVATTPVPQVATTPVSKAPVTSASMSPAARTLIYDELKRLHLVRSSPAMPLHSLPSTSRHTDRCITSTTKPTRLSSVRTHIADVRQIVHRENTTSSLHPTDRTVMKELFFNPDVHL